MDIFSYVVKYDDGSAPNPFGSFLTLATCKPKIRRAARKEDLLVGTGSVLNVGNNKLIYAGLISDVVSIEEYGSKGKYKHKRPSRDDHGIRIRGDNIYYISRGKWIQRENKFHTLENMKKDLSGENVLICKRFWYFGSDVVTIPDCFRAIIKKGPGHKRIVEAQQVKQFYGWLKSHPPGCHGRPFLMDTSEGTCETSQSRSRC